MPEAIVKDGRVQLRDAEGTPYSVPKEEAADVLAAGQYRLESADEWNQRQKGIERGTLGQQAITAVEGVAEGATLGLSTAVATGLGGDEYRRAAQERAEVNPGVRAGFEAAGTVAPALFSGGAGALGTAARLTPAGMAARGSLALEGAVARGLARAGIGGEAAGIAGRIAQRGVSAGVASGVEGAAIGLGGSLADSALEGTEWTAERALAGMEDGALYGLAGGAALGAGGAALGSLGRKAVQKMLGEGTTLQGAIKSFANKRAIKQVVGEDVQAFRKITRNGDDMARLDELANKLRARGVLGDTPADIERALQREIDDADNVAGVIGKTLDERGVRPDASRLWGEVDDQVARLRAAGPADHKIVAKKLERQVEQFRKGRSVRIAGPDGVVRRIQTDPTFTELRKFKSALGKTVNWAKAQKNIASEEMEKLYGSVARNLDEAAAAAGDDVAVAWSAANRDMDDFITLRSGMKREAQRQAKGRFFQQGDQFGGIAGALASMATGAGAPATILAAMAGSVAHKFIRQRGAAALGKLADRVARAELGMQDVAKRLAGTEGAARRGVVRAAVAARGREERREDYKQVRANLLAFQQNPGTVQAKVEQAIAPFANEQPEVAVAMARRVAGDYQWLASKLPPPMTRAGTSMTPAKEVERFTERQELKLANYAEALAAPRTVFESLDGHVNWDGIEALKERRPELWAGMREHVMAAMNEAENPPPFRRRVLLGLAFDFPADYSMTTVKRIQETYAMPEDTGNGKPAMAGITNPFEQQSEATQ